LVMGGGDGRDGDVEVQSIVRRASSLEEPEWLDAEQLTKAFIYNMILNVVLP
jgi:hypothetical protein